MDAATARILTTLATVRPAGLRRGKRCVRAAGPPMYQFSSSALYHGGGREASLLGGRISAHQERESARAATGWADCGMERNCG
jgi:hypothetical protein